MLAVNVLLLAGAKFAFAGSALPSTSSLTTPAATNGIQYRHLPSRDHHVEMRHGVVEAVNATVPSTWHHLPNRNHTLGHGPAHNITESSSVNNVLNGTAPSSWITLPRPDHRPTYGLAHSSAGVSAHDDQLIYHDEGSVSATEELIARAKMPYGCGLTAAMGTMGCLRTGVDSLGCPVFDGQPACQQAQFQAKASASDRMTVVMSRSQLTSQTSTTTPVPTPTPTQSPVYLLTTNIDTSTQTVMQTQTAMIFQTTMQTQTAVVVSTSISVATAIVTGSASYSTTAGCQRLGTVDDNGPLWYGKDCRAGPQCNKKGNMEDGSGLWVGMDCASGGERVMRRGLRNDKD